ncbi:MAG TPA: hypothetical protein PK186_07370 [candidate division Zixibacteria bacterium]|nr:hypothetical protein [candidate division Zixibacteria bacterium]MDD4918122.1 hypothetical protein [candidate division Zixibacteria bacterium]MDM7972065.1 hypothetical protein [candidate division Zixibacteria bacterium]HOD67699.1 hypothetical protein [candidate division Zixibacteria bacterium]HPM37360.1 hypothetical protein [candidate division Zixibacteria bacterium]
MTGENLFSGEAGREPREAAGAVPLFGAESSFDWMNTAVAGGGDCCYLDAATCPDCSSGMIRAGACFTCPMCGWGGCN